jgi:hypothetical protein
VGHRHPGEKFSATGLAQELQVELSLARTVGGGGGDGGGSSNSSVAATAALEAEASALAVLHAMAASSTLIWPPAPTRVFKPLPFFFFLPAALV